MFLRTLSKRERYIALATVSIASAALIYTFVIEPVWTRWSRLNNEIAAKTDALKKDSNLLAMYKTLESDYAKFAKYAKSTKKEEEELAVILTEIESIARSNSCFIVSIKPQGTKKLPSYREILVDVTAEADINKFSKFLYDVETSRNIILKVRRFTINSKSGPSDTLRGAFLISKILVD